MQTPQTPSRRKRRSALIHRVTNLLSKRLVPQFSPKPTSKQPAFETITPSNIPGTPSNFTHRRRKTSSSSSSQLSTSPLTASPASAVPPAPDRPRASHQTPCVHHRHSRPDASRRFSARFPTRTLSRLESARNTLAEKRRAKSLMGCECDAAHERDMLSARLGELAMTEMENESLRAQVDDLQRAVESVRKQAQDEVDSMVLEMQVLRKRVRLEQGHYVSYSDDEEEQQLFGTEQERDHMATLWLGERALDAAEVAARLEWHHE